MDRGFIHILFLDFLSGIFLWSCEVLGTFTDVLFWGENLGVCMYVWLRTALVCNSFTKSFRLLVSRFRRRGGHSTLLFVYSLGISSTLHFVPRADLRSNMPEIRQITVHTGLSFSNTRFRRLRW